MRKIGPSSSLFGRGVSFKERGPHHNWRLVGLILSACILLTACGPATPADGKDDSSPQVDPSSQALASGEDLEAQLLKQIALYDTYCYSDGFSPNELGDDPESWYANFACAVYYDRLEGADPNHTPSEWQDFSAEVLQMYFGHSPQQTASYLDPTYGYDTVTSFFQSLRQLEDGSIEVLVSRENYNANNQKSVTLCENRFLFQPIVLEQPENPLTAQLFQEGETVYRFLQVEMLPLEYPSAQVVEISTPEELIQLADTVNHSDHQYQGNTYKLMADIDMVGVTMPPIGRGDDVWMGDYMTRFAKKLPGFNAVFDGNGHTIRNWSYVGSDAGIGFFGCIGETGVVKNLALQDCSVEQNDRHANSMGTGGLAGTMIRGATVTNCSYSGNVIGFGYTGGLVGAVYNDPAFSTNLTVIEDSQANAHLQATHHSGGFIGMTLSGNMEVINCAAYGTLTLRTDATDTLITVGGFAGEVSCPLVSCHSGVVVRYTGRGADRMGSFVGELLEVNLLHCTIEDTAVDPERYLVGWQWYSTSRIEIDILESVQLGNTL